MQSSSYLKYIHISSKKIKHLGQTTVGLAPQEAIDRLLIMKDKRGRTLALAIKSALANATNNQKLDSKHLKIASIEILKGPFYKRWQPVSRGMAHQIKKRTSHIKVVLKEAYNQTKLTKKTEQTTMGKVNEKQEVLKKK